MGTATAILGGSFNPIHNGHLHIARGVAAALGLDSVRLIPSFRPPHKGAATDMAGAGHRVAMAKLAARSASPPRGRGGQRTGAKGVEFTVDDREVRRQGPSYTLLTVRELVADGVSPVWIIGADLLAGFATWWRVEELLVECRFAVVQRPGSKVDWSALPSVVRRLERSVVEVEPIDVSATAIREHIARGEPIDGLTPPTVVDYIHNHGLYTPPPAE